MRQLLILRHAKSSHKNDKLADYDRPLAKRGRRDSKRIGDWLNEQMLCPDYILSSPAARSKQTALKIAKRIGFDKSRIKWDERIYDSNNKTILKVLADVPKEAECVLLVGHHLGLESLILNLSNWSDIPAESKLLPTGGLAWFKTERSLSELNKKGDAQLVTIVRPRNLG